MVSWGSECSRHLKGEPAKPVAARPPGTCSGEEGINSNTYKSDKNKQGDRIGRDDSVLTIITLWGRQARGENMAGVGLVESGIGDRIRQPDLDVSG